MTTTTLPPALADLLTVEKLSDITTTRVQEWQAAVRALGTPTTTTTGSGATFTRGPVGDTKREPPV